jgi:hypothetical protein
MKAINRVELAKSAVAGGSSKGNNSASATASGDANATATVNFNQTPATPSAAA